MSACTSTSTPASAVISTFGGRLGIDDVRGVFTLERGFGVAGLVARLGGVPASGSVEVGLRVRPGPPDVWIRQLGSKRIVSRMELVDGDLLERWGPIEIRFAMGSAGGCSGMCLRSIGWSARLLMLRLSLPKALRPRIEVATRRCVGGLGQGGLDVAVTVADHRGHLMVAYRGRLFPASHPGAA